MILSTVSALGITVVIILWKDYIVCEANTKLDEIEKIIDEVECYTIHGITKEYSDGYVDGNKYACNTIKHEIRKLYHDNH